MWKPKRFKFFVKNGERPERDRNKDTDLEAHLRVRMLQMCSGNQAEKMAQEETQTMEKVAREKGVKSAVGGVCGEGTR